MVAACISSVQQQHVENSLQSLDDADLQLKQHNEVGIKTAIDTQLK